MPGAARTPVRERLDKARRFVQRGLWELEPSALGILRAALIYRLRLVVLVAEGSLRDQLLLRAAALTYKTVFSLVPLVAVMLAFFKGFGGTEAAGNSLQQQLLESATPGLGIQVMNELIRSVGNIHAGAVGGIGVILLIYTAISLLTTVEESFNHIWGVKQGRPFFWRCIIYWGVITLGPVVFAVSITATAFVESSGLLGWIREHIGLLNTGILFLTPFVFAWFGFAALYYFMPNTPVQWGSAFAGGIVGGSLWELAKHGYVYYNTTVLTTYKIYGALGAVPLFLLWVYLSWVIVLFGAEFAFARQHVKTYRREIEMEPPSLAAQTELALLAILLIAREYAAGREPVTLRRLGEALNVPVRFANDVLFRLGAAGLVREVVAREPGYVPGRDAAAITVKDVLDAMKRAGANPAFGGKVEGGVQVRELLARADAAVDRELGSVTIDKLAR